METINDLNLKITTITLLIQEKYPELAEFLNEIPITIPKEENPEINISILKDYFNSLDTLLKDYILEHPHNEAH